MDDTPPSQPAPSPSGSPYPGEGCTQPEGRALPPVPPSGTSLDTKESSVKNDLIRDFLERSGVSETIVANPWASSAVTFRHAGWRRQRDQVHAAMIRTGQSASRISSFCACGACSWLQRREKPDGTLEHRISTSTCNDRLCTPCANTRSWRLQLALKSRMNSKRLSFITLTLAGKDQGLTEKLDRLYKHFRALRAHPLWAEKVEGGAAFLEIKYNDKAKRWHPHLHIICEAGYIDQGELSDVWRGITRDSYIVDIKRVKDHAGAAAYVTKYASKPLNTSFSASTDLLDEALQALVGRRLALTFGTWYGTDLDIDSESLLNEGDEFGNPWENILPLETIIDGANAGDEYFRGLLIKAGVEARWRASLTPA